MNYSLSLSGRAGVRGQAREEFFRWLGCELRHRYADGFRELCRLPAALSVAERPSHFLLRAQEKVTKEKGTPRGRLAGVLPAKCVKGGRGFRQHILC